MPHGIEQVECGPPQGLSGDILKGYVLAFVEGFREYLDDEEVVFKVGGCVAIGLTTLGVTIALRSDEYSFFANLGLITILHVGSFLPPMFEYLIGGGIGLAVADKISKYLDERILGEDSIRSLMA